CRPGAPEPRTRSPSRRRPRLRRSACRRRPFACSPQPSAGPRARAGARPAANAASVDPSAALGVDLALGVGALLDDQIDGENFVALVLPQEHVVLLGQRLELAELHRLLLALEVGLGRLVVLAARRAVEPEHAVFGLDEAERAVLVLAPRVEGHPQERRAVAILA